MRAGTLLALVTGGLAGWWLARQTVADVRLAEPRAIPGPPQAPVESPPPTGAAPPVEPPAPAEDAAPPDPAERAMRTARSTIDARMRTLRSRPEKPGRA